MDEFDSAFQWYVVHNCVRPPAPPPGAKHTPRYCIDRLRSEAKISENLGYNAILQSQRFLLGNFDLIKRGLTVRQRGTLNTMAARTAC